MTNRNQPNLFPFNYRQNMHMKTFLTCLKKKINKIKERRNGRNIYETERVKEMTVIIVKITCYSIARLFVWCSENTKAINMFITQT